MYFFIGRRYLTRLHALIIRFIESVHSILDKTKHKVRSHEIIVCLSVIKKIKNFFFCISQK
jgi:hypothetical protein